MNLGADPNAFTGTPFQRTPRPRTPLELAVIGKHSDIIELLAESGAKFDCQGNYQTDLFYLCGTGFRKDAAELLRSMHIRG